MTHHEAQNTTVASVLEHLIEEGLDGMASALELLLNEAMKLERQAWLRAAHYERTAERRGYANGFKAKTVRSRLGSLALAVPKVRDVRDGSEPFYPWALERGERSERALKLAVEVADQAAARIVDRRGHVEEEVEAQQAYDGPAPEHLHADCLVPVAWHLPGLAADGDGAGMLHVLGPGRVLSLNNIRRSPTRGKFKSRWAPYL